MAQWKTKAPDEVYGAPEIEARLRAELPRWSHEDGVIRRRYATSGWKSSLMVVNAVGHLAEAAWHHPELAVSFDSVTVSLANHEARGVTEKDFALARKVEDVVLWRPGAEAGAVLEGTPADPRWQYIRYD
jgi:4a-hydroxytetrahydrobiopterin dehydratase